MIRYLGRFTVGMLVPSMVTAVAGAIGRLRPQIAGAASLSGRFAVQMPSLQMRLTALAQAAAGLALQGPSVRFDIATNVALMALLEAQLALLLDLQAAFGAVGVEAFVFDSTSAAVGAEVAGAIAGGLPGGAPTDHIDGFVLATRYPTTFAAMGKVFIQT